MVGTRACALLSPKELIVVALLVEGMKNKEIGDHLGTSERLSKTHFEASMTKLEFPIAWNSPYSPFTTRPWRQRLQKLSPSFRCKLTRPLTHRIRNSQRPS